MGANAQATITFAVWGPIEPEDLPGLCDRVCALLNATHPQVAYCDARTVDPTAATIDALARLQLAARKFGCQVRLRNASPDLLALVAFLGLEDVLPED